MIPCLAPARAGVRDFSDDARDTGVTRLLSAITSAQAAQMTSLNVHRTCNLKGMFFIACSVPFVTLVPGGGMHTYA